MDKGYKYVRIKPDITIQEQNYLRAYEDIFMLECVGISAMFVSTYYIYVAYKFRALPSKIPKYTAAKGATFFAMGIASTISAFTI